MYERSAIVLERYMERILEFNKTYNLKKNYYDFSDLIQEVEEYQIITAKEGKVIEDFDTTAKRIQNIQKMQERIFKANRKIEEDRYKLFADLGEDPITLENKLTKIEDTIQKNNEQLKEFRIEFIRHLGNFAEKQKERNKCAKARRIAEANHRDYIKKVINEFRAIDPKDIMNLKDFIHSEKELVKEEAADIMFRNGRNEKVGFNKDVIKRAVKTRVIIAEKEAECYILIYERMRRLIQEVDNDNIKLEKFKTELRDTSVKLAFLNAEKEYIFGFLDYERMTAINGARLHNQMMEEACNNFELDLIQINNLYELLLKEIAQKATQKSYKELYNKSYLKNIEDKEKNFKQEVNSIRINMGTVINSNYWRIDGIRNVYTVFQAEITGKFQKDLTEFMIEENEQFYKIQEELERISNEIYEESEYAVEDTQKDNYNYEYNYEQEEKEEIEEDDEEDEMEDFIFQRRRENQEEEEDELEDDVDLDYDEEDDDDEEEIYFYDDDDDDDEEEEEEYFKYERRSRVKTSNPPKRIEKKKKNKTGKRAIEEEKKHKTGKRVIEEDKKQANGIFNKLFKEKKGKRLRNE